MELILTLYVRSIQKSFYGDITGYGTSGPWKDLPGQDLLVQSLSGLAWLNGNANQPPMPFGLSIADMCAGQHLAQGILAGLIQSKTKKRTCLCPDKSFGIHPGSAV